MLVHSNAAAQRAMQPAHRRTVCPAGSSSSSKFGVASSSSVGRSTGSKVCHLLHPAISSSSSRHRGSRSCPQQQQQQQQAVLPGTAAATARSAVACHQHSHQHLQQYQFPHQHHHHQQQQQQHNQPQQQQQQHLRRRVAAASASAAAAAYEPSSSGGNASSSNTGHLDQQQQQQQQPQQQQQHQQQQQQPGLELPPLDLPPSRSAALWLNEMSEAERQQAAADWGYVQVGRPLPEGISLTALADTLPDQVFALDLTKALGYLGLSLGVMALGYSYLWYWHSICPLWQQLAAWAVIGTGYYGVFQTAVDCAHFAFWPQRPLLQDVLGAVLMAPALMSYELYRLKYFNHIMCTNQLYEDLDAWHPLLPADLADMPAWQATLTAVVMATPLKFFASIGQWFRSLEGFDLKLHPKPTRFWVWLSWTLPLGFVGVVWPALLAAGGVWGGLVTYWLGPWLVFHGWLSVISLIQHTGPHITWAEEGLPYDPAQANINGTVCVEVPQWLEVLLHHTNHHLPTHISISIPSYNLPAAQAYLQQRLGQYLTIATINANLLRNLMTAWLVYDEQQQRYVNFDEAAALVEAYRQRQANQQQPQQQEEQLLDQQQSSSNGSSSSSESVAAAGENRQGKPAVITASIPLDKLLGVRAAAAAGANGSSTSSSSSSGGGAQQLATSSSSRSSSGGDRGPSGSAAATGV